MGQRWLDGYSAHVEIYLLIDGKRHDVAQIGGGELILRNHVDIEPGTTATLVIVIDGNEERETIVLTAGSAKIEEPVPYF